MIRLLAAILVVSSPVSAAVPLCPYEVRAAYPHDSQAFTQGLLFRDGYLYESTGMEGRSTVRQVRLEDGAVVRQAHLPPHLFGEGLVDWGDELISVTWRDGVGFRWDRTSLRKKTEFHYAGEGWGLTQDGENLILSDGTSNLRFLDPSTFAERRRIVVTANGNPVRNLNELEWVRGSILANVWLTNVIVRIDPESGAITEAVDLSALKRRVGATGQDRVLNGIAYDAQGDRLFVTGKEWPLLFEIRLGGACAGESEAE
jgi:glutaminyl-peptide cyclotransferase